MIKFIYKMAFALILIGMTSISTKAEEPSIEVYGHIMTGEAAQCQIHYKANGGKGSHHGPLVEAGGTSKVSHLSETGISRQGYAFSGWNITSDGSGTFYNEGDRVILNNDLTLYAQWSKSKSPSKGPEKTGDSGYLVLWWGSLLTSLIILTLINRLKH